MWSKDKQSNVSDFPEFDPEEVVEIEEIEHDPPATERSLARRASLQILYEIDSSGHLPGMVMSNRIKAIELDGDAVRYLRMLVEGTVKHRQLLDTIIRHYATEWPVEQIALIDRNILRLALFELVIDRSVPVAVVIDEAVALARVFSSESAMSFVNGVLGRIVRDEEGLKKILEAVL